MQPVSFSCWKTIQSLHTIDWLQNYELTMNNTCFLLNILQYS